MNKMYNRIPQPMLMNSEIQLMAGLMQQLPNDKEEEEGINRSTFIH